MKSALDQRRLPAILFLFVRVSILLALPFDGLRGYGDHLHFFNLAALPGLPYLHFWVEFPPLFPFLLKAVYALSGGVEHAFTYLLVFLLTAADLGSVILFTRLAARLDDSPAVWRGVLLAGLLAALPYTWWYFDSLVLFLVLLAFEWAFSRKPAALAGVALGLGILTKLFPALILPALWRWLPPRRAAALSAAALLLTVAVYGGLWAASPQFTRASLQSQSAKGSWETVWALVDGNLHTGNFGPEIERLDPAAASRPVGNPPRVSPWISLAVFSLLGAWLFWRFHPTSLVQVLSFAGLTWVIFLLWSPGWSPQWVLYLFALILLTLPERLALLLSGLLVLVNLLEWPLLLSRGLFYSLPATVLLRTLLLLLLAWIWWQGSRTASPSAA
ncbi:MAG TPA: hypothetical protein PJ988_17540 [Anaerolinea sp.]|nr:hypothetical protein [Anaerolinea sp.]